MSVLIAVSKAMGADGIIYWEPAMNEVVREYHAGNLLECVRQAKVLLYSSHPSPNIPAPMLVWLHLICGHLTTSWIEAKDCLIRAESFCELYDPRAPLPIDYLSSHYQACLAATNGDLFWNSSKQCLEDLRERLESRKPPHGAATIRPVLVFQAVQSDRSAFESYGARLRQWQIVPPVPSPNLAVSTASTASQPSRHAASARHVPPAPPQQSHQAWVVHPYVPHPLQSRSIANGPRAFVPSPVQPFPGATFDTLLQPGGTVSDLVRHIPTTDTPDLAHNIQARLNAAASYATNARTTAQPRVSLPLPPFAPSNINVTNPPNACWTLQPGFRPNPPRVSPAFGLWFTATTFGHPKIPPMDPQYRGTA